MSEIIVRHSTPKLVKAWDMRTGQYGIVHYGEERVVVVRTVCGMVSLDGRHTWTSFRELDVMDVTLLKPGRVITITVGE